MGVNIPNRRVNAIASAGATSSMAFPTRKLTVRQAIRFRPQ